MELPEELRVPGLTELNLFADAIGFKQISEKVSDLDEVTSLIINSQNQLEDLHDLSNLSELFLDMVNFYDFLEDGGSLVEGVWNKIPDTVTAFGLYRCDMGDQEVHFVSKNTLKHFSANIQNGETSSMSIEGNLESISLHVHEDESPFRLNIDTCKILVLILEGDVVVSGNHAEKIYVFQANPFTECTYEINLENKDFVVVEKDGRGFF